jgi:hypothetical protein
VRLTLTIDDDLAAEINRRRRQQDASLKKVVNDALRLGLCAQETPPKPKQPFRMKTYDMGEQLIPLDNVAEAISLLEGDDHK